jgi:hypothetical protein
VSPVKYELGFYIPEDAILHSHRRESSKSYKYFSTRSGSSIKFEYSYLKTELGGSSNT